MIVEGNQTWVELRDAANMLHLCERQLHRYRRRYHLQEKRLGWYVYVDLDDVLWLKECIDPVGRPRIIRGDDRLPALLVKYMLNVLTWLRNVCSAALRSDDDTDPFDREDLRSIRAHYVALADAIEDARTYRDVMRAHVAQFGMPEEDQAPLEAMSAEARWAMTLIQSWFDPLFDGEEDAHDYAPGDDPGA